MSDSHALRSGARRASRMVLVGCVLVLALPLAASPAHSTAVPAANVVVSPVGASNTPEVAYAPEQVVVVEGSTLRYANADTVNHNLSSREPGLFASPFVGSGETTDVEGVSDLGPGTYDFYCTLHPTMEGTLRVEGPGGGLPDPEPEPEPDPEPSADPADTDEDVVYETLVAATNEAMALDVAADGRVVWTERDGSLNVYTPGSPVPATSQLLVSGNFCEPCIIADPDYQVSKLQADGGPPGNPFGVGGPLEAGLYGVLLDDEFEQNNTLYLFYTAPGSDQEVAPGVVWGEFRLSSFELDPATNLLDPASEEVLLIVPAEWNNPAHFGGDLDYLPDGTIVLTTGDNVVPSASNGYGARDHRNHWTNAELTSGNPADRRGKVLRLREDGSVPDGTRPGEIPNPFLGKEGWNPYIEDSPENVFVGDFAGTPDDGWIEFDPYVYSLGWKQAWRSVVMPNGDMYVSDVGPDAGADDPERGPRGFEEMSRIPYGGGAHAGWPRCQGPNWAYIDVDWETLETNGPLDCSEDAVIARSIANPDDPDQMITGMTGATIYYPSGPCDGSGDHTYACDRWPIVGSGGKTSEPVVFYPQDVEGPLALPDRYRDRLFVLEWSRRYILTVPADPTTADLNLDGGTWDLVEPPPATVEPNLDAPQSSVSVRTAGYLSPIDATIGPDGALYFLEYGATYFNGENGRLSRIRAAEPQSSSAALDAAVGSREGGTAGQHDEATASGGTAADGPSQNSAGDAASLAGAGDTAAGRLASSPSAPWRSPTAIVGALLAVALLGPVRRRHLIP